MVYRRRKQHIYIGCLVRLVLGTIVAALIFAIPILVLAFIFNVNLDPNAGMWWGGLLGTLLVIYIGKTTLDALL